MLTKDYDEFYSLAKKRRNWILFCDLDGVVFDHTWKDFLVPSTDNGLTTWDLWCQASVMDPVMDHTRDLINWHPTSKIHFITSRPIKYSNIYVNKLSEVVCDGYALFCRPLDNFDLPPKLKVSLISEVMDPTQEFLFIDDDLDTVLAVNKAFPHSICHHAEFLTKETK